jgi:hypothetical protein
MQSLFALDTRCVYCEVGTELLFIIDIKVCKNRGRLVALLTGFVTVSANVCCSSAWSLSSFHPSGI